VNRKKIKGGPGKQGVAGKQLRLAQEIKYIQRRAAQYNARFVGVGPLVFFSTQTGDAWNAGSLRPTRCTTRPRRGP
jgi:hypothetical protein